MDRNINCNSNFSQKRVALRKESVDRNNPPVKPTEISPKSLSARRAWIEIRRCRAALSAAVVALRKESVDRNDVIRPAIDVFLAVALRKESVDRNAEDWLNAGLLSVALRKESVDRNSVPFRPASHLSSRSPQGERG